MCETLVVFFYFLVPFSRFSNWFHTFFQMFLIVLISPHDVTTASRPSRHLHPTIPPPPLSPSPCSLLLIGAEAS